MGSSTRVVLVSGGGENQHVGNARRQAHQGGCSQDATCGDAASPRSTEGRLPGLSRQLQLGDEAG